MLEHTTYFQDCSKLFQQHALGDMLKSPEYKGIERQLDSILVLSDRVLSAFIEDPEFGRISIVADLLSEINKPPKDQDSNLASFETLLEKTELWLKPLLSLVDSAKSAKLKANANTYTLFPCIRELGLLTQAELDTKEQDVVNAIKNDVRQLIFWNRKDRNYLTHATHHVPEYIKARFPSVALITLIAPVYKPQAVIKARLRGLVTNPLPLEMQQLIKMIGSEQMKHLERFRAREKWVQRLTEYLENKPDSSKPYMLLSGYEGIGKSALVSQLAAKLSMAVDPIGRYAGSVRKTAPWLPTVILHFGKQSNHPTTIVRLLIAQANTLLLKPFPLPEYEVAKSCDEWSSKRHFLAGTSDNTKKDAYYDTSDRYAQGIDIATYPDIKQYPQVLYLIFEKIAEEHGGVLLIIDAIDEISSDGTALEFLPERLPHNVSALLTARQNTPAIHWLKSNREVYGVHLDELEREEIPSMTQLEPENVINEKIWKASKGWPLLIVETTRYLQQDDKALGDMTYYTKADSVFERQAIEWQNGSEQLNEVLHFLSVFEAVIPIDLAIIQSFLEFRFPGTCLSLADLRELLRPVSSQIEGLEIGEVKLALKAFAEYIRVRYCSTLDLERKLNFITKWISEEEELDSKVVAAFLKYWTDPSQVDKAKLRKVAANLSEMLLKRREPTFLFDVFRYAQHRRNKRDEILPFAVAALEAAADRGHAQAMQILGSCLLDGRGVTKDVERGKKWLFKAAGSGETSAMASLAMRFIEGKGLQKDVNEGEKWIRKAAETGDSNTKTLLAYLLLAGKSSKNCAEGEKILRHLAEDGNEQAIFVLANCLLDGMGLAKSTEEGSKLLQGLVDNGNKKAAYTLALRRLDGDGLDIDAAEGCLLLENLAKSGSIQAMISLGNRFIDGRGLPQQIEGGKEWLQKAVAADSKAAMAILANRLLSGDKLSQNIEEGERLLYKAANSGNLEAMRTLGLRLIRGDSIRQDLKRGEAWLKKAAEGGNTTAMHQLGVAYLKGDRLHKKAKQSEYRLRQSAEEGNIDAMVSLGQGLLDGNVLKQNVEDGLKVLNEAVSLGSGVACAVLGLHSYDNKDFLSAGRFFLQGHKFGSLSCAKDLVYLARRRENPLCNEMPPITQLFDILLKNREPTGLMNYALALASGFQYPKNWLEADRIVAALEQSGEIQEILGWWHKELALKDDAEGHLVIGWLTRHGLVKDPDRLAVKERLNRARKDGWDVPEWMDAQA